LTAQPQLGVLAADRYDISREGVMADRLNAGSLLVFPRSSVPNRAQGGEARASGSRDAWHPFAAV